MYLWAIVLEEVEGLIGSNRVDNVSLHTCRRYYWREENTIIWSVCDIPVLLPGSSCWVIKEVTTIHYSIIVD